MVSYEMSLNGVGLVERSRWRAVNCTLILCFAHNESTDGRDTEGGAQLLFTATVRGLGKEGERDSG